ncbi:MAG: hypothetical protein WBO04_04945 [Steroidobacteraceae bacterium]
MSHPPDRTLLKPRSTRDLRAEILSLAAELATNDAIARLIVRSPLISPQTVQHEWNRMLPAIASEVRSRMALAIEDPGDADPSEGRRQTDAVPLARPNYRYEILRILLEADLSGEPSPSILELIQDIGASQTPIRAALEELKSSGVVRATPRGLLGVCAADGLQIGAGCIEGVFRDRRG